MNKKTEARDVARLTSMRKTGGVTVATILLLLFSVIPMTVQSQQEDPECETFRHPDYGLSCDRGDGLLEIFSEDGHSMGYLHAVSDPAPPDDGVAGSPGAGGTPSSGTMFPTPGTRTPVCTTGTYFTRIIYARASDDTDDYTANVPFIRTLTKNANWVIDQAAVATGGKADILVECSGGQPIVHNEVLSTSKASATFASIKSDLISNGHNDPKLHYWVFYDHSLGSGACNGAGNIAADSSPGVGNANNGNGVGSPGTHFAQYWHCNTNSNDYAAYVWVHEWAHNVGAVQNDAPHTTGAWHCTDGYDTMCYNDGGSSSGSYKKTNCPSAIFDCGKDDYFHCDPASGSYLSNHWNLGHTNNRYLTINCSPPSSVGGFIADGTPANPAMVSQAAMVAISVLGALLLVGLRRRN